jgi:hypothetical protein
MGTVSFANIELGGKYDRPLLADLWGYAGYQAFGMGIFTPADQPTIVLFASEEHPNTHYENRFDGETLWMDGADKGRTDERVTASLARDEEVHLFYRVGNIGDFTYHGRVYLASATPRPDKPTRFVFTVERKLAEIDEELVTDQASDANDPEGRKRLRLHVVYERSRKNREKALAYHKPVCAACDFDFNAFYGAELANAFVEIHHRVSITELDGRIVNPETDLVPLCSNCHRMVHRRRGEIMRVEDLRAVITERNLLWSSLIGS